MSCLLGGFDWFSSSLSDNSLHCCSLGRATLDIFDYIYIDAFGKGKQLTVKECEYLIGQHVTAALYGVVNVKKVLQRMVGNLLSLGKR